MASVAAQEVTIQYKNWRGESAERHLVPGEITFGVTKWHPEPQWLLSAYDVDRQANRQFALKDIESWIELSYTVLSHAGVEGDIGAALEGKRKRIAERGDLPYITVDRQLELLEALASVPVGRWLIANGGLNGKWTDYVLSGAERGQDYSELEAFLLSKAPIVQATQQRLAIFQKLIQQQVANGKVFASVPCGLMADLLFLDYSQVSEIQLVGIDVDPDSIVHACARAKKRGLEAQMRFHLRDAWALDVVAEFDLLTSNGLNIYESDGERVVELYRSFYRSLKPGGQLITSFLTPPPGGETPSPWQMEKLQLEDLLLQKVLFVDILQAGWQAYRTEDETRRQLEAAGFDRVEFFPDEAGIFPTVVAHKRHE